MPVSIAYLGLDESGSLPSETNWFVMAGVLTDRPEAVANLIQRVAIQSAKRSHIYKRPAEFKWNNASQRFRAKVIQRLAEARVEIFTLAVHKGGRKIENSPEHFAMLAGELLQAVWNIYPNVALMIDRHFTAPSQIAIVNTFLHRAWPVAGILSVAHVDSQRVPLVQLADFVAGGVYAWHKGADATIQPIEAKIRVAQVSDWQTVKRDWVARGK